MATAALRRIVISGCFVRRRSLGLTFIVVIFVILVTLSFNPFQRIHGLLRFPHISPSLDDSNLARIVHQSWKTNKLPKRFAKWRLSWIKCFPTWEHKLWTDSDNRHFISEFYPWFLPYYDGFRENIHRVDAVRYFYLFHYGGLYTDLDNECLRPFSALLTNYNIVFGAINGQFNSFIKEGYVQNSLMYSKPGHHFWLEMIHEIMARAQKKEYMIPESVAGPVTLVHCINKYRERHKQDVKIYPPEYFNPNSWMKNRTNGCKDYNQMTEEDEQRCKEAHKDAYVLQYHTQTWGRGRDRVLKR